MQKTRYILVADGGSAKVFRAEGKPARLELVVQRDNPAGRRMASEIVSDRAGVQMSGSGGYHSVAGDENPSLHAENMFAADLADYLRHARLRNEFDELMIAAPPKFLRQHLGKECRECVVQEIDKDLVRTNERDLIPYFF